MATRRRSTRAVSSVFEGLQLLDDLIRQDYERLLTDRDSVRLGEWLKMVELRAKLQPDGDAQADFWKQLEEIRQRHLPMTGRRTRLQSEPAQELCAEKAGRRRGRR